MIQPCDNCGETDEHECIIDGVVYGPWDDGQPSGMDLHGNLIYD